MIKIYDDFFSEDENIIINNLLERPRWSFAGGGPEIDSRGNRIAPVPSYFWHMNNLEEEHYFLFLYDNVIKKLELENASLVRCYANGQTAGQSGIPHTDDGDLTILYYPTPWEHFLGGHLNFIKDGDIEKVVEYKQNRLVSFPAKMRHYASPPERHYAGLRTSLAFKVKINDFS